MAKKKPKNWVKSLDKLASTACRERDAYTCQRCGKKHKATHAAHIFTRNNKSTRWDLNNLVTLCYYCHIHWAHRAPVEFTLWISQYKGEDNMKELELKARKIVKLYVADYREIEEELKQNIKDFTS